MFSTAHFCKRPPYLAEKRRKTLRIFSSGRLFFLLFGANLQKLRNRVSSFLRMDVWERQRKNIHKKPASVHHHRDVMWWDMYVYSKRQQKNSISEAKNVTLGPCKQYFKWMTKATHPVLRRPRRCKNLKGERVTFGKDVHPSTDSSIWMEVKMQLFRVIRTWKSAFICRLLLTVRRN